MRGVLGLVVLLCAPAPVDAQQRLAGRVIAVHDGDTVSIRTSKTTLRVRLADIDCPEIGQPRGSQAKDFTSKLVFGHDVSIETRGLDQYNRVIGRVTLRPLHEDDFLTFDVLSKSNVVLARS